MSESEFTHLNEAGEVHMVDVSGKPATKRTAIAKGLVVMPGDIADRFLAGELEKGDAAAVARVAGIQGAKRTADLIPLCHPIPLDSVSIQLDRHGRGIAIEATVTCTGPTGVEMEALTAVSTTALTIYDMVKGVERGVTIESVRLHSKEGGRSGKWESEQVVD